MKRKLLAGLATIVACLSVGVTVSAGSVTTLPAPGSASTVAQLVATSLLIKTVPSNLLPKLSLAPTDDPGTYYAIANQACAGLKKCVFGDVNSKVVVVLYGDSHAQMWLPALVPVALRQHFKLILVWQPGCPDIAVVTTKACDSFRATTLLQIAALHPALVLLDNKTWVIDGQGLSNVTASQWTADQEKTIRALQSSKTKVAIIADTNAFNVSVPQCLASHLTSVQKCAVPDPNLRYKNHYASERTAASATKAFYIPTQRWLCTQSKCSPIVGNMVTYFDDGHVSSTYAEYLANVWYSAILTILTP